ncbi:MAG TPA: hypothetical protein DHV62_02460 [Elusimicrobia bacterium]|jgi:hypothetical protein|nr:hypothetical protein [Elusimicrobiota bacterium]
MKNLNKKILLVVMFFGLHGAVNGEEEIPNESTETVKQVKIEGEFDLPLLNLDKEKIKELAKEERNTPVGVFISALNVYLTPLPIIGEKEELKKELIKKVKKLEKYVYGLYFDTAKSSLRLFRFRETKDEKWLNAEFTKEEIQMYQGLILGELFELLDHQLYGSMPYNKINIVSIEYYKKDIVKMKLEKLVKTKEGLKYFPAASVIMIKEKGKWKFAGDESRLDGKIEEFLTDPNKFFSNAEKKTRERHKKEAEVRQKHLEWEKKRQEEMKKKKSE